MAPYHICDSLFSQKVGHGIKPGNGNNNRGYNLGVTTAGAAFVASSNGYGGMKTVLSGLRKNGLLDFLLAEFGVSEFFMSVVL